MKRTLKLETGKHDREQCPVSATLRGVQPGGASVRLVRSGDGRGVHCQARETADGLALEWILDKAPRGETIVYEAEVAAAAKGERSAGVPGVVLRPSADQVDFVVSGLDFASYYHGPRTLKPYLGPIMGPFGKSFTRLDPETAEHPHHRSVWVGHGDVNGIDFWGEPQQGRAGVHGRQVNKAISGIEQGPVYGSLSAVNTWTALSGGDVLEEETTLKVYATADFLRLIDVRVDLKALYGEVRLAGTKEAGPLAVRVAESMKVDNGGSFVNGCGGIEEGECWSKRAPWCDYFGAVDGHCLGIAVFDHPANDSYPTTWHIRNYGLMSPNPSLIGPRTIEPGQTLSLRYRLAFHLGDVRQAGIADRFADYAWPPRVTVG
jgi:hypothetical protein